MTREEADFIGGMNMCDEISNEAYKKIMVHCDILEQKPICPSAGVDCEDCPAYGYKGGTWIPVGERMPKDGKSVLFCDIDEDIMIGYHVKGEKDTHFKQDGTFEDMKCVRAWMPLPEPYKAEGSEKE